MMATTANRNTCSDTAFTSRISAAQKEAEEAMALAARSKARADSVEPTSSDGEKREPHAIDRIEEETGRHRGGSTLLDLLQSIVPKARGEKHRGSTVLDMLTRKKERLASIADNTEHYARLGEEKVLGDKGDEGAEITGNRSQEGHKGANSSTFLLPYQELVRRSYGHQYVQFLVALLIAANFLVSALEAQLLQPKGSSGDVIFFYLDSTFTALFTVELLVNLYGSWWRPFWASGWNWFDFVVVSVSLTALFLEDMPGVNVLRLLRAFRVLRLFKRIGSLKVIIEGVIASIPGVLNTFAIQVILMAIWAIIGVQFFGPLQPGHFARFTTAMFTMWQVTTMDGWSDVARELIYEQHVSFASAFFVSYTFLSGIVMTNVVVAVLLESYLSYAEQAEAERKAEAEKKRKRWNKAKSMSRAHSLVGPRTSNGDLVEAMAAVAPAAPIALTAAAIATPAATAGPAATVVPVAAAALAATTAPAAAGAPAAPAAKAAPASLDTSTAIATAAAAVQGAPAAPAPMGAAPSTVAATSMVAAAAPAAPAASIAPAPPPHPPPASAPAIQGTDGNGGASRPAKPCSCGVQGVAECLDLDSELEGELMHHAQRLKDGTKQEQLEDAARDVVDKGAEAVAPEAAMAELMRRREMEVARREAEVAKREAAVAELMGREAELAKREAAVAEAMGRREAEVVKREAEITQREAGVAKREAAAATSKHADVEAAMAVMVELMGRREAEVAAGNVLLDCLETKLQEEEMTQRDSARAKREAAVDLCENGGTDGGEREIVGLFLHS